MAQEDVEKHWYDDDQFSSGLDSDDSPLLSQRSYDKRRYTEYPPAKEVRDRRSHLSLLMKSILFCTMMISFCVLLYIPVYNRANYQITKAFVAGWPKQTNRDTKLYVLPDRVTTIHEPNNICLKHDTKNKLFLLIIVCSATNHIYRRHTIRKTWGNYTKFIELSKNFNIVTDKYKDYLKNNVTNTSSTRARREMSVASSNRTRKKRDLPGIARILPEIARVLQSNMANKTEDVPEKRFDDESSNMLQEFDMNQELGEDTEEKIDYDYESNIMKIPPRGFEENLDLQKVVSLLKHQNYLQIQEELEDSNTDIEYRVVFLLGLPANSNNGTAQALIEQEVEMYGDIIQERFIDSYNNLTLKSIMMLKWINNKCNNSVRYILKTDDDMYINVPKLIANLKERALAHDSRPQKTNEYLLIGALFCGARPVLDANNKWYSPRYMYSGRVYPRYLSGTGYAASAPAAAALYAAALRTPLFHLEDIYITGICALRASPQLVPHDDPAFSYRPSHTSAINVCVMHAHVTTHHVLSKSMDKLTTALMDPDVVDRCERTRLDTVRRNRLKTKRKPKRLT